MWKIMFYLWFSSSRFSTLFMLDMSRLLCIFLITYVLSDEIKFDLQRNLTQAFKDDYSNIVVCKNDKPSYRMSGINDSFTVQLHSNFELIHANCSLTRVGEEVVQLDARYSFGDQNRIANNNSYDYKMKIFINSSMYGNITCKFMAAISFSNIELVARELAINWATPTCVASIVQTADPDSEEDDVEGSPVAGYIGVLGEPFDHLNIPEDEQYKTLIAYEENFIFNIKCVAFKYGTKFNGTITRDIINHNSTEDPSQQVSRSTLAKNGVDTYQCRLQLNDNRTEYSCVENNESPMRNRIFGLITYKVKNKDPKTKDSGSQSSGMIIGGVLCIIFLVILVLALLYNRWKTVSKETKAKIKKSSTELEDNLNLNPNRVSYVELDFDQNVDSDFVPMETAQYATVIGVMAPRESDDLNSEH